MVVDSREDRREHVRLKTGRIEQVILKELAGTICLREGLRRQLAVWPSCNPHDLTLERSWQTGDVSPCGHGGHVLIGIRIGVTWGWRLLGISPVRSQDQDGEQCDQHSRSVHFCFVAPLSSVCGGLTRTDPAAPVFIPMTVVSWKQRKSAATVESRT
jgi:hypothetical protein